MHKHCKTLCRLPPRTTSRTYSHALNPLGMVVRAPVPPQCPTSRKHNGCQGLSGLGRIKLSPPCCVFTDCLRYFHIWFIFARSNGVMWGSHSRELPAPRGGLGLGDSAGVTRRDHGHRSLTEVGQQSWQQLAANTHRDCDAARDPSARHPSVIVLFPRENKGSQPHTNKIKNVVLCVFFPPPLVLFSDYVEPAEKVFISVCKLNALGVFLQLCPRLCWIC